MKIPDCLLKKTLSFGDQEQINALKKLQPKYDENGKELKKFRVKWELAAHLDEEVDAINRADAMKKITEMYMDAPESYEDFLEFNIKYCEESK